MLNVDPEVLAIGDLDDDLSVVIETYRICTAKMDDLSRGDMFYMLGILCGRLSKKEGRKTNA